MPRGTGMFRRRLLRAGAGTPDEAALAAAVTRAVESACAAGEHAAETDDETGDEVCRHCGAVVDDYADVALATHAWAWDEDTNGRNYRFCTRCRRDEDACQPNEYHGPIACTNHP